MKIKLIADSTCDLTQELIDRYDIEITPLYITMGNSSRLDFVDVKPADVFEYYRQGKGLSKTAAVNVADYAELYGSLVGKYDAIIQFTISSVYSTCCQNARIAAQEVEGIDVYVVDTRNLSTGIGILVLAASDMVEKGMDAADIYEALVGMTEKVECSFILDTLEFLSKGGRCSSLAALGANVLKLKPTIEVTDSGMVVGKKYRGVLSKTAPQYIRDHLSGRDDIRTDRLFFTHSGCAPELVELCVETIRDCISVDNLYITTAGTTVSSHCGPNCLGVIYMKK